MAHQSDKVPHHIAVVMDGNGRWATQRFLPRAAGHRQGLESLRRCIKHCTHRGVGALTVFAFSSENWQRPADEVNTLMELLLMALGREVAQFHKEGIKIKFLGDAKSLSKPIQHSISKAETLTEGNSQFLLNICFNYGGQWDVLQAVKHLVETGQALTAEALEGALATAHCGNPDLIIRTGGELRLSNFLLWQAAYAELFFTESLWPDFDESELDTAIAAYQQRQRRFGKTSEQVSKTNTLAENL
jgi:undecaprenyl diphosphate synthase